ncbi:MAG: hypothetical protein ACTSU5_06845 [Promethearchaeota archaeon]
MIWVTLQYILVAVLVLDLLWTAYLVAFPAASKIPEDPDNLVAKGYISTVQTVSVYILVIAWWSVAFSWAYMWGDALINLVPTIIVGASTVPIVARIIKELTARDLLLWVALITSTIVVLVIIDTKTDLAWALLPIAVHIVVALILGIVPRVKPGAGEFLGKRIFASPSFYVKATDTRFYLVLDVVALVEFLFQVPGFSILTPLLPGV